MALVKGTNCGFVSVAPVADPLESVGTMDNYTVGFKSTSPAGSNKVTEIGWYQSSITNDAADYDCGIYSHDAGNNRPNALISAKSDGSTTSDSTPGWYNYSGLNISLTASTTYWIAAGVNDVVNPNQIDTANDIGEKYDWKTTGAAPCPDPWDVSGGTQAKLAAIYGKYEVSGGATPVKIKPQIMIISKMFQLWPTLPLIGAIRNPKLTKREMLNPLNWIKK